MKRFHFLQRSCTFIMIERGSYLKALFCIISKRVRQKLRKCILQGSLQSLFCKKQVLARGPKPNKVLCALLWWFCIVNTKISKYCTFKGSESCSIICNIDQQYLKNCLAKESLGCVTKMECSDRSLPNESTFENLINYCSLYKLPRKNHATQIKMFCTCEAKNFLFCLHVVISSFYSSRHKACVLSILIWLNTKDPILEMIIAAFPASILLEVLLSKVI